MKRIAPAAALAVVAALGILVALLTAAPPGVTYRAKVRPSTPVQLDAGRACFAISVLPSDTRYVRLSAAPGAPVPRSVTLRAAQLPPITTGPGVRRGPEGRAVEYRLPAPTTSSSLAPQVCLLVGARGAMVLGEGDQPSITLLGQSHSNWIAAIPDLADRAAFGRGTVLGDAALPLALALLLAAWLLAIRVASTAMRAERAVSRGTAARVGAVGAMFAAAFALTTPPFMAADEPVHLQYTQLVASQQALPQTVEERGNVTAPQAELLLGAAATSLVQFSPDRRTPWGDPEDEALDAQLKTLPAGGARDSFTNSSSQPPAYYVGGAVVQGITGGSVLDRLLILRLYSALLFGLAVAGAVIFAREAVPRAGGLAVAGGTMLASLPIAAFVGGSINPDALLVAVSAWVLALVARILRRGVTIKRSLALGALVGLGLLSKLTFAALVPAVTLAAVVVVVRGWRQGELRRALLCTAAAAGLAALIAAPYFGWTLLSGRGVVFGPPGPPAPATSLRETFTYAIDLYVGAFGPVQDRIEGSGPWQIWLGGLTGRLGWLDYGVPDLWVRRIAVVWGALFVLALVGLARSVRARRTIPVDALVYLVAAASLMFVIAQAGLTARLGGTPGFEQARYLLPIAAIGAGGVALALRQVPGGRLRDWSAAGVVVFGLVNGTVAYLLTIGRYFA